MKKTSELILLFIFILLSTAFRAYKLDYKSMWFDEIWTLGYARNSVSDIPSLLVRDDAPPLYHFVLHYWMMLGEGSRNLRFLSVLFGVLMVYATYLLGEKLFGYKVGLLSAYMASFSLILVRESQTVRPYTVYGFFTLMSLYFYYRILAEGKNRRLVSGYVLCTAAAIYTHYFGLIVLATEWAYLTIYYRSDKKWLRQYFALFLSVILIYSPWIIFFIKYSGPLWHDKNVRFYSSSSWFESRFVNLLSVIGLVSNTKYLAPVFVLLIAYAVSKSYGERKREYDLLFLAGLLSIIPLAFIRTFHTKFVIYLAPAYYILASKGVASIKNKKLTAVAVFLITAGSLTVLSREYVSQTADWRSVAEYVESNAREGDIVIVEPSTEKVSFEYYFKPEKLQVLSLTESDGTPGKTMGALSDYPHDRAWIVYTDQNLAQFDPYGKVTSFLEENRINKSEFAWITVYLLE